MSTITLYGTPLSLFTGRARAYLIKAGLDYRETIPITQHYKDQVLPKAGGRAGIPVIETESGQVIRDGAAIIDHYEALTGNQFSPTTHKQRVVSRLFDVIGAEGLLRPAMHYRWNFPEENLEFLRFHFTSMVPRMEGRVERADANTDRMRAAGRAFGAVPETFEVIESHYADVMDALNTHLLQYPYLLGGKPSIGDFGMIAPLYAHLGRDPKPLMLMQTRAVNLFRWVERMNRPEPDIGEFEVQEASYLANDDVPATLITALKTLAVDFVPETLAAADCINEWIGDQPDLPSGTEAARGVGMCTFELHGQTINALAQPYRFYLLKRVQDEVASLSDADAAAVRAMLAECNMLPLLDVKLTREIGRQNNLEVWA